MNLIKRNSNLTPSSYSNLIDRFFDDDFFHWPVSGRNRESWNIPAANIVENDKEFGIELAVPGMKKEDFSLKLENDILTISSESKEEDEIKKDNYTRREFSYQSFQRSFRLPEGKIDENKIKASYQDGVLKLNLPKREEHKPQPGRTIEIS